MGWTAGGPLPGDGEFAAPGIPAFYFSFKFRGRSSDVCSEWEQIMVITDYRVRSILRTYTRQLQRGKASVRLVGRDSEDRKSGTEKVSISDEGRRRMMMERLTNNALEQMYPKEDNGPGTDNIE
jgi:hypothetical protein